MIMLSSKLPWREEENTVLLDRWSDADVSEYIALLCDLTVRKSGIMAVDKNGDPDPDDIGKQFCSRDLSRRVDGDGVERG